MKSKRRHELQTNVLADWVGEKIKAIQPYTNWIIGGVIAVLAIGIFMTIRANRQESASEEGWARFAAASSKGFEGVTSDEPLDLKNAVSELKDVALEYDGTTLASYARLTLGDLNLRSGQTKYRANRTAAGEHFKSASKFYEEVVTNSQNAELKNRATYSLAKSYEWQMKLEKAKETYAKVEGAYATEAQMRVRDLERPGTHSFYDQYAQWKPKVQPSETDQRYPAPGFDLDPGDSPADGEIDFGKFLDDTATGSDADNPTESAPENDADGPANGEAEGDGTETDTADPAAVEGDAVEGDAGEGEAGEEDVGEGDAGEGDAGEEDVGEGDAGEGDAGEGDAGEGDAGEGDTGDGEASSEGGEADAGAATDSDAGGAANPESDSGDAASSPGNVPDEP